MLDVDDYDLDNERYPSSIFITSKSGFWRDKKGILHRISEMQTSHLKNIIKMFDNNGVIPPEIISLELEYREQKNETINQFNSFKGEF